MLIKAQKSDRGEEFTLNEFQKYCEDHGIHRFLVASRSPQQNRVAERKNRTIMDIIRSIFKSKKITKRVLDRSSSMCGLPIQLISNKKAYLEKRHKEHGVERNLEFSISKFLEALLMCICQTKRETSFMLKMKNTSSSVMTLILMDTGFTILS